MLTTAQNGCCKAFADAVASALFFVSHIDISEKSVYNEEKHYERMCCPMAGRFYDNDAPKRSGNITNIVLLVVSLLCVATIVFCVVGTISYLGGGDKDEVSGPVPAELFRFQCAPQYARSPRQAARFRRRGHPLPPSPDPSISFSILSPFPSAQAAYSVFVFCAAMW